MNLDNPVLLGAEVGLTHGLEVALGDDEGLADL